MKNVFKLIFAFVAVACSAQYEDVLLTFQVEEPTSSEVVLVCHNEVKIFPLDSLGKAEAVLNDMDAAYMRLFYGREFKWIYVERGDRATISFKGNDFSSSFRFEGKKAPAVDYLNRVKLMALPDEDFALPFNEYVAKLSAKETDALRLLKANDLGWVGDSSIWSKVGSDIHMVPP